MERGISITLDVASIIVLVAVIAIFLPKTVNQKYFKKVWTASMVILGMLAFDIMYVAFFGSTERKAVIGAFFSKECYLALNTLAVRVWCEYVGLLLWDKEYSKRPSAIYFDIVTFVNLLLVAVNAYVNVLFRISWEGQFEVSYFGMIFFTAINYSMLVIAAGSILKNRMMLRKGVFKLLIIFPAIVVIAEILSFPFRKISFVFAYGVAAVILIAIFKNYSGLKEIDRLIDHAIAEKLFFVCYQPIFTLSDGKCRSCEALLRLRDDEGNFVSPVEVVTAAESNGRIGDVFDCVLECVCCYLSSPGFSTLGVNKVHVNISTIQLDDNEFASRFLRVVKAAELSPSVFCVEVTESATANDNEALSQNLNTLASAGVSLALDDYGSGYSNLRRILELPFDSIKLDCSLIRSIGGDKADAVVETSLDMIRRMRLTAVAEGVETQEQLDYLKRLGCDEIQGFYYSRPITATEFTDYIHKLNEEG